MAHALAAEAPESELKQVYDISRRTIAAARFAGVKKSLTGPAPRHKVVFGTTYGISVKTVTATDANRHFSRLLREISRGATVTIVSRGRPVAVMSPSRTGEGQRRALKRTLMARLRRAKPTGRRNWIREELYDGA